MPRYSEDMIRERSPFWFPRRATFIPGDGTAANPYVIPGSPTIVCPAPRVGTPSLLVTNAYQLNLRLLTEQLQRQLKMGSQAGSIN